ncbi:major paralogous domain-containing protein [Fibrobacter sp. UWCM]|uniref:fibrobacter succinogenes major paralogous domain-containing protein n=1 Tax=Fibrobacter sp. UWCM TaxID=1896208 RepID=UPI000922A9A6|nr:fibrobacter succinogenes major paralogous domain-containing protein [Fibrobacter sp. UWCM]SHG59001.1 major paralogous domain-containing protein [Fibrobacter sp. UWCM]
MKNTFAKMFTVCALAGVLGFALTACDDSSSAGGDGGETSTKSSNSSSSSVTPSDVEGSSKTAWDYLNPDIDYGEFTDERDGQVYKTVKIGDQVWMAENLNYAYTGVPFDNGNYTSDSTSWCYDNDPANCAKYGRLYTWAAAMDSVGEWSTNGKGCGLDNTCSVASAGSATLVRGICPKGWHLPSNDEWKDLIVTVDGSITEYTSSNTAGSKLKSQTGWTASSGITNEDAFGFSALPAGYRGNGGDYYSEGNDARFWSSTVPGSDYYAYFMELYFYIDSASLYNNYKCNGFSVRCVKDSE